MMQVLLSQKDLSVSGDFSDPIARVYVRELSKACPINDDAISVLVLDQPAAATAPLVRLAGSSDPQLSRVAMAALGTAKLQTGSTKQGFNLLRRAVEEDETIDWPGRAEAEADLGLAYLLVGNEQVGLTAPKPASKPLPLTSIWSKAWRTNWTTSDRPRRKTRPSPSRAGSLT
jgi:hypothetical protein